MSRSDDDIAMGNDEHEELFPVIGGDDEPGTCGHEFGLGGITYYCERHPHEVDGYGPRFRHAAAIDEGHAERTDEQDGFGRADLMTWGEDGNGDGQDWEVAWGALAGYGAEDGGPS